MATGIDKAQYDVEIVHFGDQPGRVSEAEAEWVVIIDFNEQLREISVCEPVVHNRCAKLSISIDGNGEPADVHMMTRMS